MPRGAAHGRRAAAPSTRPGVHRERSRSRAGALVATALVAVLLAALGVAVVPGGWRPGGVGATVGERPPLVQPSSPSSFEPQTDAGIGAGHGDRLTTADWTGTTQGVFRKTDPAAVAAYEQWLGAPVPIAADNPSSEDWFQIANPGYALDAWAGSGRRLLMGVAMLPNDVEGVSIAEGATGAYDDWYRQLGENLVATGHEDAILRIGWEFNLGNSLWSSPDPDAWVAYWRRIVTQLEAAEGQQFRFEWNSNNGDGTAYDAALYYPGDDVVDYVGIDVYDTSGREGTYPIPEGCTGECAADRQRAAWSRQIYGGDRGLRFWAEFAREHDKQMAMSEWGVWDRFDNTGGKDNPYYIEQMHAFFADPQNHVGYQSYFEDQNFFGTHILSTDTTMPESAATFRELFGGEGGAALAAGTASAASASAEGDGG